MIEAFFWARAEMLSGHTCFCRHGRLMKCPAATGAAGQGF